MWALTVYCLIGTLASMTGRHGAKGLYTFFVTKSVTKLAHWMQTYCGPTPQRRSGIQAQLAGLLLQGRTPCHVFIVVHAACCGLPSVLYSTLARASPV